MRKAVCLLLGSLLVSGSSPAVARGGDDDKYFYCWARVNPGAAVNAFYSYIHAYSEFDGSVGRRWDVQLYNQQLYNMRSTGCSGPFDSREEANEAEKQDQANARSWRRLDIE